jgi:hypothetical protein
LEKQLGRIRNVHLRDLVLVVASLALERILLEFARILSAHPIKKEARLNLRNWRHEPTDVTNVDSERITNIKETFFQETASSMRYHAVALHFSEA